MLRCTFVPHPGQTIRDAAIRIATAITMIAALALPGHAQTLIWNAPGAPANSFELTDGPSPNPQPGDQVVTATNTCDNATVTGTFSNPDGVADPGEAFVDLRTPTTIDWWINGPADNGDSLFYTMEFSGNAVENLQFTLFDIDADNPPITAWQDRVEVTATFAGAIPVQVVGGASTSCTGSGTVLAACNGTSSTGFGAAAGNVNVTIPGPVQAVTVRVTPGPLDTPTALGGDQLSGMSGFTFDCSTVPVTLAAFHAERSGETIAIEWSTLTETANVGFHLYGESNDDSAEPRRLNARLVLGESIDSLAPRHYRVEIPSTAVDRLYLAEVDVRGRERWSGPFEVGIGYGFKPKAAPIDWSAVQAQRQAQSQDQHLALGQELGKQESVRKPDRGAPPSYRIELSATGLYRIDFTDLPALADVPSADLALVRDGVPIPIRVREGPDGAPAFVEFYGEAVDTLYTHTAVYRLLADRGSAVRIPHDRRVPAAATESHYAATRMVTIDREYSFGSPNGDPWYERRILAFTSPASANFEIEADDLVAESDDATLIVDLWGVTDFPDIAPDHHVVIRLNGVEVAADRFDGLTARRFEVPIPAGLLVEGTNVVTLTLPGDTGADFDLVHIEGYGVRYTRRTAAENDRLALQTDATALTVTGFTDPDIVAYRNRRGRIRFLEGIEVTASGDHFQVDLPGVRRGTADFVVASAAGVRAPDVIRLADPVDPIPTTAADYWILTHPDFASHLDPLIDARRAEGYTVAVVDTEQVYETYSGGVFDPNAIRLLVGDIVSRGARFLLLVGGDSYDYLDHGASGSISFIPTLYRATHPVVRFTPSDAALADADGNGTPDLAIGRFPVRTTGELASMITKTLTYDPTKRQGLRAADAAVGAFSFGTSSNDLLAPFGDWSFTDAYIESAGVGAARQIALDSLDQGPPLVHYFGHSGPSGWTFDGLLTASDAPNLENQGSPSLVMQWGCWNGYHPVPSYDTLAHRLLLSGEQGAAAVVGAATLTEIASDIAMARRVYERLAVPGTTVGEALEGARAELAALGFKDIVLGMTLLGDPALRVVP